MSVSLLLTIITITKDDAGGLARTLASTERWRGEAWVEQIVVDGGRASARIDDGRVRIIRQVSTGIAGAFNEGLAAAQGEWVWFVNGGDRPYEALPASWLLELLRASAADLIVGGIVYDADGRLRRHPPLHRQWPLVDFWVPHPSTIARRGLFERFGMFDPDFRIAGDYEWWLRVMSADVRVDLISVPFVRFAQGGLSQRADTQPVIALETARAVRLHEKALWRGVVRQVGRFFRQWARAVCSTWRSS